MTKIFLGGTCNESTWRDEIIEYLERDNIDYFNPVVDDWTPECMTKELEERENCDFCLYTITPKMTGVYSIAEVVDDSNKRPKKTVLVLLQDDEEHGFNDGQWKSLWAMAKMVKENGGQVFETLELAAEYVGENK